MKMKSHILRGIAYVALSAAVVCLGACASIMHGTHQDVGISSSPSGAQVSIDGQSMGKTPVVAHLKRKENHIVHLELAGYKPYDTTVTRSVSGWVWGNIVIGGLIGLAVDAISGGLYKLTPEQVSASLLSAGTAGTVLPGDGVYIAVVLRPEPGWQKVGQLVRD
jgi:hypothetical protein